MNYDVYDEVAFKRPIVIKGEGGKTYLVDAGERLEIVKILANDFYKLERELTGDRFTLPKTLLNKFTEKLTRRDDNSIAIMNLLKAANAGWFN